MNQSQLPSTIFGMHDSGAEHFFTDVGKRAWIVRSVVVTDGPGNFTDLSNAGHGVIVRLNHGYRPAGTIPLSSQYDTFAQQCAQYVAGSQGAQIWIIGNETNLRSERPEFGTPQEETITPALLAQCFAKCRAAIKGLPGHGDDWVIPSPPGPWNNESPYAGNEAGDWVIYFRDLLNECIRLKALPDALALHTYTHEARMDAGLVENEDHFHDPPFTERHFQFRAYRDFLGVVPAALRNRPVLITESQHLPWEDGNKQWIQRAYAEIDAWNAGSNHQPIQAFCLFRWEANSGDNEQAGWSISDRRGLQDDLRAALGNEYRVRWLDAGVKPEPVKPAQPGKPEQPKPEQPKPPQPTPGLLPLAKVRWFTEEAVRKLEAGDDAGAREILTGTVSPWFYASYPQHAGDLPNAQAHTTARWFSEEATRLIEAGKRDEARTTLLEHVLAWLSSPGPGEMGILSVEMPGRKRRKTTKAKRTTKKARKTTGVSFEVGAEEEPAPAATAETALRDVLVPAGDQHQLLPFNREAALQKRMFADGLVPNSAEFNITVGDVTYVAQRAEHLLTGQVRVYYAPTTNFGDVRFVMRGAASALNTPFKGGNRITQEFGERPEYYQQFHFAGHEGVDMVPRDGDRDVYCIEDGEIITDVDIPGDPKSNAYGIHVEVFSAENRRAWKYCHLSENRVTAHQLVKRGDILGRMGGTGNVKGDHLHLNLKLLTDKSMPLTPDNGFKGLSNPLPLLETLNAAQTSTPLRDALLAQAEAGQVIAFNTQAALQKSMFADAFCPNSAEFNIKVDGTEYVAQRGENLDNGAVRVYYAPTSNFADVHFVEK